jgi:hypothetical protein
MDSTVPVSISIPLSLQCLGAASAWILKPTYMLLTLWLLFRLRRDRAPEMRWLWWGLLAFEIGETACAVNYLAYDLTSVPWELVHDGGMVIAIGLITMAVLEFVDRRMLFQFAQGKTCALVRFCRECPHRAGAACRFMPLFAFACLTGAFLAVLPLTRPAVLDYPMRVNFFGQWYLSYHMPAYQIFEGRVCPIVGIVLFVACWLMLRLRSDPRMVLERIVFSFAIGCVAFSIFRFANHRINWDWPVWFDFWEEATEWISIVGIALCLHVFGDRLAETEGGA